MEPKSCSKGMVTDTHFFHYDMPGISKDTIIVNAYDNTVDVKSEDPQRKYHRTYEIPPETDIETAKSANNNGILKITFKKKVQPKVKTIKVE